MSSPKGDDDSSLMPGPQGKTPRLYEVERGQKTESYIVAITGNKVPVKFVKDAPIVPGAPSDEPHKVILLPKDQSIAEVPLHRPTQPTAPIVVSQQPQQQPKVDVVPVSNQPSTKQQPPADIRKPEPPVRYIPSTTTTTARPNDAPTQPMKKSTPPPSYEEHNDPDVKYKPATKDVNKGLPNVEPQARDELLPAKEDNGNFGLSLAELERYKNDPFWRTLRWILFVLFWLLWILMFLAAILIVALSPGCAVKVAPSWWQSATAYHIWTPSFQDSDGNGLGDLNGAVDRLENIRRLGVSAIWASPLLLSDGFSDAIRDFRAIDSKLGVNADGDKFIQAVHDKGMRVVMSIPVSITSNEHDWFIRSSKASLPENANYSGYYHWRSSGVEPYMSEFRNTSVYYIHYANKPNWPMLNWQNSALRQEMFDVFSYWIDKGVDGFHLNDIEYLARISNGSAPNWPAIYDVLRDIKDHIETYANKSETASGKKIIIYASRDNAKENDKKQLAASGLDSVINYELGMVGKANQICYSNEDSIAGCVHELLSDVLAFHKDNDQVIPMWEFGSPSLPRLTSRVQSAKQAEMLTMLQLLLPGTNSFYYGEEIGMHDLRNDSATPPQRGAMQWDDSKNAGFSSADKPQVEVDPSYKKINWAQQYSESRSPLKVFQKLAKMRVRDEILAFGDAHIGDLIDGAFILARYPSSEQNTTQGHVLFGAFNFGVSSVKLPFAGIPVLASSPNLGSAQFVTATSNTEGFYARQEIDLSSGAVVVAPEQGIVFKVAL
ncbi:unnamed protein product [Anisakis simplex]|uniref:alpha-glucosidase n=1 Tax=Anisakis simplex TaxID=6269 RepID=A0A0M3K1N9_ANISI|nr:unnamed protein product [Anisakis simplex]